MRLFELARELKTSNRDLLSQAKTLDVEVDSYVVDLEADDVATLRSGFRQRASIEVADDEAAMNRKFEAKRKLAAEAIAAALARETAALAAAAARARQALADQQARRNAPIAAPAAPVVVAEMQSELPLCTVSGAVMRMDLADVPALMFRNVAHGGLNMVYRRADGNIGWVDPQA